MDSSRKRVIASDRLRVMTNVISNWGALIVSAVINFLLSPFVVHSLGNEAYGAWVLVGSLVGYLGLLDLGVRGAVTKFVATHHAGARHDDAGRIASAALAIFCGAGLTAIVGSALIARFGLPFFEISAEYTEIAPTIVLLAGGTIAISIVSGVFGGIVVARQRFDLLNLTTVAIAVIRALAVVLALRAEGGLLALALVQLGISAAQGVANLWLSLWVYPELRLRLTGFKRDDVRMILSFGLLSALLHVSSSVIFYSDSVVIGAFLPVGLITFFAIAANIVEQARGLISGISGTITPMVGALEGQNEMDRVSAVLITGARYATLFCLPISITLILRGHSFIGLWMGDDYAQPAGDVLVLLAIGLFAGASFQVSVSTMLGINKHRGLVPAFGVEALCNVGLSVALLPTYGINGVALGTLLPRLAMALFFGPWYARRNVGIPMKEFWVATLVRPCFASFPFALGTWAIEVYWPASNLLVYFGQVALAGPLGLLGAWWIFFSAAEREQLSAAMGRFLQSARG